MRLGALAALPLAALALAGCEDAPRTGPEEKARLTTKVFLESCARRQPLHALELLTEPTRSRFVAAGEDLRGCIDVLALETPPPPRRLPEYFRGARVARVELHSEQFATAEVAFPDGARSRLEVENSGDKWFITNPHFPPLDIEPVEG